MIIPAHIKSSISAIFAPLLYGRMIKIWEWKIAIRGYGAVKI
jgi:hypothetical protein